MWCYLSSWPYSTKNKLIIAELNGRKIHPAEAPEDDSGSGCHTYQRLDDTIHNAVCSSSKSHYASKFCSLSNFIQASKTITDLQYVIQNAQNDIEELKEVHNKRENELQTSLRDTKEQLQDHVDALNALQDRYEERNTQYHTLRHQNTDLLTVVASSDRRRDALIAENSKLRDERKLVDEALAQARNALLSSAHPQISHFESLSAANRALLSEKDALGKRLASMTHDFDFTRQQYQLASIAAAEATSRLSELETLNETLAKKASGEIAKAKTMTVQVALAQQEADVERLENENREMKELLRKKERGRGVVTRTGSVAPKSPRMGGSSPGRSRQGSRAPGSRGVSPVRGFLGVRKGRGPVD